MFSIKVDTPKNSGGIGSSRSLEIHQMLVPHEPLRNSTASSQMLNFEQYENFECNPAVYAIATEDLTWIDFSLDRSDRLANSHDSVFESISGVGGFETIMSESVPIETQLLNELDDLIDLLQSARRSNDLGLPLHPLRSTYKTDQTLRISH